MFYTYLYLHKTLKKAQENNSLSSTFYFILFFLHVKEQGYTREEYSKYEK